MIKTKETVYQYEEIKQEGGSKCGSGGLVGWDMKMRSVKEIRVMERKGRKKEAVCVVTIRAKKNKSKL